MKFSCNSNTLQKSINIVEKAVSQRSTVPIMENIFLQLEDQKLLLRGNDLEIGIENIIETDQTEADGKVLIHAKTISNIISKLQNQKVSINVDDQFKIWIKAENVDFEILGMPTEEYPKFPDLENGVKVTLSVEELKNLIKYTIFAVSFDDTKQFLNGIMVKNIDNNIIFVATDGYRLSLKQAEIEPTEKNFDVIIPYKAMNELYKILQISEAESKIELFFSESQVSFRMDQFVLVSRLIQGQFPDYKQVIPQETLNVFQVPRLSLLSACERASIIASVSNNVVRLNFTDTELGIHANSPSLGEFNEEIAIKREGGQDSLQIAFNVRLIIDAIKHLEMDEIRIENNSEYSPCVIKPKSGEDYVYIIMPIRTSDIPDNN